MIWDSFGIRCKHDMYTYKYNFFIYIVIVNKNHSYLYLFRTMLELLFSKFPFFSLIFRVFCSIYFSHNKHNINLLHRFMVISDDYCICLQSSTFIIELCSKLFLLFSFKITIYSFFSIFNIQLLAFSFIHFQNLCLL